MNKSVILFTAWILEQYLVNVLALYISSLYSVRASKVCIGGGVYANISQTQGIIHAARKGGGVRGGRMSNAGLNTLISINNMYHVFAFGHNCCRIV